MPWSAASNKLCIGGKGIMTDLNDLVALAVVNMLIWAGIFIYLWRLDAKVKRWEKEEE